MSIVLNYAEDMGLQLLQMECILEENSEILVNLTTVLD